MKKDRVSRVVNPESRESLIQAATASEQRFSKPQNVPPPAKKRCQGRGGPMSRACGLPNSGRRIPGKFGKPASTPRIGCQQASTPLIGCEQASTPLIDRQQASTPLIGCQQKLANILARHDATKAPVCQRLQLQEQISKARERRKSQGDDEMTEVDLEIARNQTPSTNSTNGAHVAQFNSNGAHVVQVNSNGAHMAQTKSAKHEWCKSLGSGPQRTVEDAQRSVKLIPAPYQSVNPKQQLKLWSTNGTNTSLGVKYSTPISGPRLLGTGSKPSSLDAINCHSSQPVQPETFPGPRLFGIGSRSSSLSSIDYPLASKVPIKVPCSKTSAIPFVPAQPVTVSPSPAPANLISKMSGKRPNPFVPPNALNPEDIYFNRSGLVYGERKKSHQVINYIRIGNKTKHNWRNENANTKGKPCTITLASQKIDESGSAEAVVSVNQSVRVDSMSKPAYTPFVPRELTVEDVKCLKYVAQETRRYVDTPLDFFLKTVVSGLSLTDLQLHFNTVFEKMVELLCPMPPVDYLADAIIWRLLSTFGHAMVVEPIPHEVKAAEQQCRVEAAMPEPYRKLMIVIGKLKTEVAEYESLPDHLVAKFKIFFERGRDKMTELRLVSLGRFFGVLFDKFFPDTSEPMNLLYYVMTTRPNATHPLFYGMLCSNPDPYTMLPLVFNYHAVSLRDRAILYAIFQSLHFSKSRFYLHIWTHMKTLGHSHTELNWNELADNLVHELADCNVEYRRLDAMKALKLISLQAGSDWLYTHFVRTWFSLVKEHEEQKYRVKFLLADYIRVVSSVCNQLLTRGYNFEEMGGSTPKLKSIQQIVRTFLEKSPEITSVLNEVLGCGGTQTKVQVTENNTGPTETRAPESKQFGGKDPSPVGELKKKKKKKKKKRNKHGSNHYVDLDACHN